MENKAKINKILTDNASTPIIFIGANASEITNAVVIDAHIPSAELGILPTENGYKYPQFVRQLMALQMKGIMPVVVIESIDKISKDEQEKFYGLLKYRGLNGYKLPQNARIALLADKATDIANRIVQLSLVYKMGGMNGE